MDNFFIEGIWVWLRENGQYFLSIVNFCVEGVVVFWIDYGQVFIYKQSIIIYQKVIVMYFMNEEGVDDMVFLIEFYGGFIMYNLFQWYKRN